MAYNRLHRQIEYLVVFRSMEQFGRLTQALQISVIEKFIITKYAYSPRNVRSKLQPPDLQAPMILHLRSFGHAKLACTQSTYDKSELNVRVGFGTSLV